MNSRNLTTIWSSDSWNWADLGALVNLEKVELDDFPIEPINILRTITSTKFNTLLLTCTTRYPGDWNGLELQLKDFFNRMNGRSLNFYLTSSSINVKFDQERANEFLTRLKRHGITIDKTLVKG